MESNYDEDVSENPFLVELQKDYNEVFNRATAGGWIICVPRRGSFTKGALVESDFLEHILIPQDDPDVSTNFRTLNGKEVNVTNRVLTIDHNKAESCSSHLLFEETFYTSDVRKYRIWCIEHPLEQGALAANNHVSTVSSLRECLDLLWTEILDRCVLKDLEAGLRKFENEHTDEFDKKPLQIQRDLVGALYTSSLRTVLKDSRVQERSTVDKHFLQNVKLSVETYILHGLRKLLTRSVSSYTALEDANLNKIIKNSNDIQPNQLGIREDLVDGIQRGKLELSRLGSFTTVVGKIECLRRTVRYVTQGKSSVSSDDLLPVLIYLIIKSGLANWMVQVAFVKNFRFSVSSVYEADEAGFLITSFEAGIEHVKSGVIKTSDVKNEQNLNPSNGREEGISISYLFRCIQLDDLEEVKRILLKRVPQNFNEIPLCHPLCNCEPCERNLAWDRNSDWPTIHSRDDHGSTPLHIASLCGYVTIVDFLLNAGANNNEIDMDGLTPLHHACIRGHQNTVLLLLHSNADPNIADSRGNTPLHLSSDHGHEGCVKALLYFSEQTRLPLNVDPANSNGDTPLHHASKWGYVGIVEILIEYGANCRITNKRGQTPMTFAHNARIATLLEAGSSTVVHRYNPKRQVSTLESPRNQNHKSESYSSNTHHPSIDRLLSAINEGDVRLACYYLGLENRSDKHSSTKTFCHPLCDCERCRSVDESQDNLKNNTVVSINACNAEGETALHAASNVGCIEIINLLLDTGANVNATTKLEGRTALHLACIYDRIKVAKILLNCATCDINVKDYKGLTPLHLVVQNNNVKFVELLLRYGADTKIRDSHGNTPLQLAERQLTGDPFSTILLNICELLKKHSLNGL